MIWTVDLQLADFSALNPVPVTLAIYHSLRIGALNPSNEKAKRIHASQHRCVQTVRSNFLKTMMGAMSRPVTWD